MTREDVERIIDLDAPNRLMLQGFEYRVRDGRYTEMSIGGGSSVQFRLRRSTFGIGAQGFVVVDSGGAKATLSGKWNWVCLSPKKFKEPLTEVITVADELKIIVFNKSDFDWAEKYAALVSPACKLYLQPEWGKASQMTPMIVEYIKAHPQWELSLQIHKYINVP